MSSILETREVLKNIQQAWARGHQTAMLFMTEVRGSAYRRPGAKMMMATDGVMFGTLSGGCLESDLYGWMEKAVSEQRPQLREYDLSENELWGLGIGCKGCVRILIQPIYPSDPFWKKTAEMIQKDAAISLIMEIPSGLRAAISESGEEWGDTVSLPKQVREHTISRVAQRTRAEAIEVDGKKYYIDTIKPSEHLIIAGAGHDAVPVVELAAKAGFSVTVLDPRTEFNNSRRFPKAKHTVMEPSNMKSNEFSGAWWIMMNHHQMRDEAALRLAIESAPKFIGVLGPLSRTEEMLANIGYEFSSGPIQAPIGLDLGGETIEEVALSIVSQLLAARNQRQAIPLHGKVKIHG